MQGAAQKPEAQGRTSKSPLQTKKTPQLRVQVDRMKYGFSRHSRLSAHLRCSRAVSPKIWGWKGLGLEIPQVRVQIVYI